MNLYFLVSGGSFPRKFSLQYGLSTSLYEPEAAGYPHTLPGLRQHRVRSDDLLSQPRLPLITENGLRLGNPVAREAAKSFWSMDMLKDRMVHFAEQIETSHSDSEASSDVDMDGDCSESSLLFDESTPLRLPLLTTSAPSFTSSSLQPAARQEPDTSSEHNSPSVSAVALLQSRVPAATPSSQPVPVPPLLLARRISVDGRRTSLTKLQSSRITASRRSLSVDGRTLTIHSKEALSLIPARKTRSLDPAFISRRKSVGTL